MLCSKGMVTFFLVSGHTPLKRFFKFISFFLKAHLDFLFYFDFGVVKHLVVWFESFCFVSAYINDLSICVCLKCPFGCLLFFYYVKRNLASGIFLEHNLLCKITYIYIVWLKSLKSHVNVNVKTSFWFNSINEWCHSFNLHGFNHMNISCIQYSLAISQLHKAVWLFL